MTPSKASKELEKPVEKEISVQQEEPAVNEEQTGNNHNSIDEDELIIKDELDHECFEEVDTVGEVEKEVRSYCQLQMRVNVTVCFCVLQEEEAPPKAKVNNNKDEIKADDNIETSNNDNEDSLNLTIGEEDEQLLRDEENDVAKSKGNLNCEAFCLSKCFLRHNFINVLSLFASWN